MKSPVFILPTKGATQYRGKYPARARSVSAGTTGLHVELNDGTRLWTAKGADHFADLPRVNTDLSDFRARAVPMTAEQYETLQEAAALLRERAQIAGHGRRAELESRVRAIVDSIKADDSHYAKRNAEARRAETLANAGGRYAFDPAKPYRVNNRGPWGSTCFDFATLDEARAYLDGQARRRAFVTPGAAPAGPHGDSMDPLQSFITWAEGSETLAELGWTAPADGERLWTAPASPDSIGVRKAADGYAVADLNGNGDGADESNVSHFMEYANAEAEARRRAARYGVDVYDYAAKADEAATVEAAKPVRRDNVEYHAGKAARAEGVAADACPYMAGGDRAARWSLGWKEADDAARKVIDLTPTWAGMGGTFRALIENGNAEGRATAWQEIGKALALADERNALASALSALAIVANETAHCVGEPGTMARDELDSALAAAFALLNK